MKNACVCLITIDLEQMTLRHRAIEKKERKKWSRRFRVSDLHRLANAALTTFIGFHWSSRSGRFHLSWFDNHRNRLNWRASRSYGSVALLIRLKVVYLGGPDQFWFWHRSTSHALKGRNRHAACSFHLPPGCDLWILWISQELVFSLHDVSWLWNLCVLLFQVSSKNLPRYK